VGGTLRKVLLLAALCMALALALSTPVMAQSASADPCPDPDFPRATPDGCQASDLPDVEAGDDSMASPAASPGASASASPLTEGIGPAGPIDTVPLNPDGTCPEGYVTVNAPFCAQESPNTPGRIFGYGEGDVASVSASPTASASASASASVSVLPETGGSVSVMVLVPLVLLVGTGILAFGLVRRN
jgi:hypothetical protein